MPLTGPAPNFGNRPNEPHANRVHLEGTGDANSPGKLASCKPLTERRTEPVTGIRQHAAEAHASRRHAVDLRQCDLGLAASRSICGRNTGSLQALLIAYPTVRKVKPQRHHDWHFTPGERQ